MRQISTKPAILLTVLILFSSIAYAAGPIWPLKIPVDFASGYGDYRKDRFHAGFDLRTGGAIGQPVYAPSDGYISRIKMSYFGYGKGLYMVGSDGRMYVFGHLSGFNPGLDSLVTFAQFAAKRYYVELNFPQDSIPVKQGQLLAFSGQTGAGAPHLHFEARTLDNHPINPLTHGFSVKDKFRPTFTRIGFQLTDEQSFFAGGERERFYSVREAKKGQYVLDSIPYLNRPTGVLADCFDRLNASGMKLAVYDLSLIVDDTTSYQATIDTLSFESGGAADAVYDYVQAAGGKDDTRRLFLSRETDPTFPGVRKTGADRGVLGLKGMAIGRHTARIRAIDALGNSSELAFKFYWGPQGSVLPLDSMVPVNDSVTQYYFTPVADYKKLNIDSVTVFLNRGKLWGATPDARNKWLPTGQLLVTISGNYVDLAAMRLVFTTRDKSRFADPLFNGYQARSPQRLTIDYKITEDGFMVTAALATRRASRCRLELYYQGKLLGTELPKTFVNMDVAQWIVPPLPQYARIDRIGVATSEDTLLKADMLDSLNIGIVGLSDSTVLEADSMFSVLFLKSDVYAPRFVAVKRTRIGNRDALHLASEHYQVFPEVFVLRSPFKIRLRPIKHVPGVEFARLYRLDGEHNRWQWITERATPDTLHGTSRMGGSFASVVDYDPPTISDVNPQHELTVLKNFDKIRFKVADNLAGFEDDRNFTVKVDGAWQIPEFDPETGLCEVRILKALATGEHHLSIEVRDRVGHEGQQYLRFKVSARVSGSKGK